MENTLQKTKFTAIIVTVLGFACFAGILATMGGFRRIDILNSEVPDTSVPSPTFSHVGGFYDAPIYLELSVPEGTTVYYTLDCTDPDETAAVYTDPIYLENATAHENTYSMRTDISTGYYVDLIEKFHAKSGVLGYLAPDYLVDKCNVVRAVAIDAQGKASEIVTSSYFVGIDISQYSGCKFISVVTDPANLFDYETGIYVTGKVFDDNLDNLEQQSLAGKYSYSQSWPANYYQRGIEWERPAKIDFFSEDGQLILTQQNGAIRVQGGISRGTVPRSLNLYASPSDKGNDVFSLDFFSTGYIPDAVTLANGGNRALTKFNDVMMRSRCSQLNFATMHYEPYILFLEGEYWGFYWLAEKYDAAFISHYYGVDKDNILMIKNGDVAVGSKKSAILYTQMCKEISSLDMTQDANYERACMLIDIDSYIDYYAAMAYIARQEDWPWTNFALWRSINIDDSPYADAKWRWMLFDCNSTSMATSIINHNTLEHIIVSDPVFYSLWKNQKFRTQFQNRLLQIADECFDRDEMAAFIDGYDSSMRDTLEKSWTRFYSSNNNKLEAYELRMDNYRQFFEQRRPVVESWFN